MQTIAIINKKGGTGKTTSAVNLGVALQRLGQRVLLIDFDPQGNLSFNLGIFKVGYDISNALIGEVGFKQTLIRKEGLDVSPSTPDLSQVELALGTFYRREEVLKSLLEEVDGYDYALIDCPPGGRLLQQNALSAANWAMVPMQMEVLNVKGLMQIMEDLDETRRTLNPNLRFLGVLPIAYKTQRRFFGRANKFQGNLYRHMESELQVNFLKSTIRLDQHIKEAPAKGKSVHLYAPKSRGAEDYTALANEILSMTRRRIAAAV